MLKRVTVTAVPAKVAAAQDYLRFAEVARCGGPAAMSSDHYPLNPRDLSTRETVVYNAALEVLRLYFTGEMEFAVTPARDDDTDDDKPPSRQLVE